uniref:Uncharacterized protein n=1 Tax=Sphaerodactylus townsendi TaxID=933632 RepID=A0ACB8GF35_9SAUR
MGDFFRWLGQTVGVEIAGVAGRFMGQGLRREANNWEDEVVASEVEWAKAPATPVGWEPSLEKEALQVGAQVLAELGLKVLALVGPSQVVLVLEELELVGPGDLHLLVEGPDQGGLALDEPGQGPLAGAPYPAPDDAGPGGTRLSRLARPPVMSGAYAKPQLPMQ